MATFRSEAVFAAVFALTIGLSSVADAQSSRRDRHAGYYYPKPDAVEVYDARVRELPGASYGRRLGFVVGLTSELLQRPFSPEYAIFAKGTRAEKLIIVANQRGRLNTIFRVRALLATLTSVARATPVFQEHDLEERLTFFDLAFMLGFRQLTVSDGETFAHQVLFK